MKIFEILDMVPLTAKWVTKDKAEFALDGVKYGILIQRETIDTSKKHITIANISFGRLTSGKFNSDNDLDTSITNAGKVRTVLSTVATACLNNPWLLSTDMICLAAADQVKSKRSMIYSIALNEIMRKVPKFENLIKAKTLNDTIILLLSSIPKLDEDEINFITTHLGIHDKVYLSTQNGV